MEDPGPLIVDISSDDESSFGDGRKAGGCGFGKGEFTEDDCYWLTKLLDEVDGTKDDDDSDDVVVVSEVCAKPSRKSRLESLKQSAKVGNFSNVDDDDCVVLDGDPDEPLEVVNAKVDDTKDKDNDLGDDSDDLEIVGEKGEVACRDFPHARHLCVKFVFASTPHKSHCSLCHCYVCDSLAPCSKWGDGLCTEDHCNANDKEEHWKVERKRIKKGGKPMPVNPSPITPMTGNTIDSYLLEAVLQTPRISVPPPPNSFPLNQVYRPPSIYTRTLSSNVGVSSAGNQGRIGSVPMHNHGSGFVPPQRHPTHKNRVPSRTETNNAGSRSARDFTPFLKLTNRHVSGSTLPHRLHQRYHPFPATGSHGSASQNGRNAGPPVFPRTMPSLPVGHKNYVSSQPPMHSSSYSRNWNRDPIVPQPQMSSQPCSINDFGSSSHLQQKLPLQSSMENLISLPSPNGFQPNSPFPSPTLSPHQSDGVAAFGNQLHTRSMISSTPSVGDNFESQPSQVQGHFSPSNLLIDALNDIQYGGHTHGGLVTSPTDFGINCGPSFGHGNQEFDAGVSQNKDILPAESSQLSSEFLPNDDGHRLVAPTIENSQPFVVLADDSSQIDGALGVPLSPVWNEFSPGTSIGLDTACRLELAGNYDEDLYSKLCLENYLFVILFLAKQIIPLYI